MRTETKESHDLERRTFGARRLGDLNLFTGALLCVFFGAALGLSIYVLWQIDSMPITTTLKEKMMHRKSKAMADILDKLVRGDMQGLENSAEHMRSIGVHLDWHLSSELYEDNDERFRQSTLDLIEAAERKDYDAAKESVMRLERSCIECHELVNFQSNAAP